MTKIFIIFSAIIFLMVIPSMYTMSLEDFRRQLQASTMINANNQQSSTTTGTGNVVSQNSVNNAVANSNSNTDATGTTGNNLASSLSSMSNTVNGVTTGGTVGVTSGTNIPTTTTIGTINGGGFPFTTSTGNTGTTGTTTGITGTTIGTPLVASTGTTGATTDTEGTTGATTGTTTSIPLVTGTSGAQANPVVGANTTTTQSAATIGGDTEGGNVIIPNANLINFNMSDPTQVAAFCVSEAAFQASLNNNQSNVVAGAGNTVDQTGANNVATASAGDASATAADTEASATNTQGNAVLGTDNAADQTAANNGTVTVGNLDDYHTFLYKLLCVNNGTIATPTTLSNTQTNAVGGTDNIVSQSAANNGVATATAGGV